jgi:WD40 repeat protein
MAKLFAFNDRTIRTWEFPSGKLLKRFVGAELEVCCLTFSSDGIDFTRCYSLRADDVSTMLLATFL